MGAKTGKSLKLYYKVGGVAGSVGTWEVLEIVRDVTLTREKTLADATTRGGGGHKQVVPGLKDAGVDFEMVWDPEDPGFEAISDAYNGDLVIGLAILDGVKESGTGLVADFHVGKFERQEPLDDTVKAAVTAKPAYSATAPVWMENGSPALS